MHTRKTIVDFALDRLRSADTTIKAIAQKWVNEIILEIAIRGQFPFWRDTFSITTAASTQDYALPYRLISIYGNLAGDTPKRPLTPLNDSDYKNILYDISLTGLPFRFTILGGPSSPFYEVGTVAATLDSTTITGTGTTFTSAMVGMSIIFDDDTNNEYTIASFTDATHLELSRSYTTTSITSKSYQIEPVGRYNLRLYKIPTQIETITGIMQVRPPSVMKDFEPIPMPPHMHTILESGMLFWIAKWDNENPNDYVLAQKKFQQDIVDALRGIPHTQNPVQEFERRPRHLPHRQPTPILPTTNYVDPFF